MYETGKNRKNFFDLSANADPALEKVATEFERQNKLTGFVKGMVAMEGIPVWEKSQIFKRKITNTLARGSESETLVEVFTPIVQQDSNFVNGFFFSKIVVDIVKLHLYRANDYDLYPYGNIGSSVVTAELITMKILELNEEVFGHRKYELIDNNVFKQPEATSTFRTIELDNSLNNNSGFQTCRMKKKDRTFTCYYNITPQCISTLNWCTSCQLLFYYTNCPTTPSGGGSGGGGGTSGGYNWPPDPPINTGGGGSGRSGGGTPSCGGNCTGIANCGTVASKIVQGRVPCSGCGNGPVVFNPIGTHTLHFQR